MYALIEKIAPIWSKKLRKIILEFFSSLKFSSNHGRTVKYPAIGYDYESKDYSNLFFAGTVTHSLDFRKSSGGFIHGFRYTIRSLHRIMEHRYHKVEWPSTKLPIIDLINFVLIRINEAAGPYQMFDQLVDIISFDEYVFKTLYIFTILNLMHIVNKKILNTLKKFH